MTQTRSALPVDFEFGMAMAAYLIEGAVHEDDRGPSIWDTFSHAGRRWPPVTPVTWAATTASVIQRMSR